MRAGGTEGTGKESEKELIWKKREENTNKAHTDRNWHHRYGKWDSVHQADPDSVHRERWRKNERERFVAPRSEGHEMNRAKGPSGVCRGVGMCVSGEWAGMVAGRVNRTSWRNEERRPINPAIVANQNPPREGLQFGSALMGERKEDVLGGNLQILSFFYLCVVLMGRPTCAVLHLNSIERPVLELCLFNI